MAKITQVYGGRASIAFHSRGKKHYYVVSVPELGVFDMFQPSVTQVIGLKDKSGALVYWATECMEKYINADLDDHVKQSGEAEGVIHVGAVRAMAKRARDNYKDVKDEKATIGSITHRVLEQELNARAGLCKHPELPLRVDEMLAPDVSKDMIDAANNCVFAGFQFFNEHHIEILQSEAVRWSPRYGFLGTGDLIARVDGQLAALDYKTGKRIYNTVWLQLAAYQKAWEEEHPDEPLELRLAINVGRDGVLSHICRDNQSVVSDFQAFLGLLRAWRWEEENKEYRPKPAPRIIGPLN